MSLCGNLSNLEKMGANNYSGNEEIVIMGSFCKILKYFAAFVAIKTCSNVSN